MLKVMSHRYLATITCSELRSPIGYLPFHAYVMCLHYMYLDALAVII